MCRRLMRLLILNWRDLKHPRAGGSEVYAQNLARHWAADGHQVTFFCSASADLPAREECDGYTLLRRGTRLSVYREAKAYFDEEGRGAYDAVLDVVNTRPFMTPRWAHGVRVVALIHQVAREVWRYEAPWPASLLGRHVLEPRWLAAYRKTPVLTVSPSSRQSLLEYGLSDVTVVHEGVDAPLDHPLPPRAEAPTMLFVGRLTGNKRPQEALAAHALVRSRLPDAQLWVVGDGPLANRLRRSAGAGVTFYGRVNAAIKQDLMASAHALVATSIREGWGLTISEAARLGTRSITYDVPGLRDSVRASGGILTAPTPEGLAAELARTLPSWQKAGRTDLGDAGVLDWGAVAAEVLFYMAARDGGAPFDPLGSPS